jgi:putative DNA primase/helicase
MPLSALQERLAAIVGTSREEPPSPDYLRIIAADYQSSGLPDLSTPEGQAALEPFIADGVEVVILDNLSTLCRTGKENEAEGWLPVQEWALKLRRRGISGIFVHHAGKSGAQRGTSRREDVLDTVISLRHSESYSPDQGAAFEVHLEKARSVHGEAAKPFEARLEVRFGAAIWTMTDLEDTLTGRVVALLNDGLKQRDVAAELGIGLGTVCRHRKKAIEQGLLTGSEQ